MNQTTPCIIAIRRPTNYFFGGSRDFIVWIDGQRIGRVKRKLPAEFPVDAGEHTVTVSMDWVRSPAMRLVISPGTRTELSIGTRSSLILKFFLPLGLVAFAAGVLVEVLRQTAPVSGENWLVRSASFGFVFAAIFATYLWVTLRYFQDYWALYSLTVTAPVT